MSDGTIAGVGHDAQDDGVFESGAQLLRWVPITPFATSGTLRLEGGRLSFRTVMRSRIVFDVPVNEVHSVAPMTSLGLHLWHGSTRYRLSVGAPVYVPTVGESLTGVVGEVASIPGRLAHDRKNRADAASWLEMLRAAAGTPPPGLRVRRPWPGWTWAVGVVLATLVIVGIITAVTLLAG